MRAFLAAALLGALSLAPGSAAAEGEDAAQAPPDAQAPDTAPAQPAAALPGPIRPILLANIGGHARDGLALGVDLGLRVAPVMARWAYRVAIARGGSVAYSSGRLGWIFAENAWAAGYAGVGAGRLTYDYDLPGPSVGVTALSAEAGIALGGRCWLGPLLGVHVEALAPLRRPADPRSGTLGTPWLSAAVDLNLLGFIEPLLRPAVRWTPFTCP